MGWNYWVVRIAAGDNPPQEWVEILKHLSKLLPDDYINKIEVAAFTIRGQRTARWRIDPSDSEYSTRENALGAAKKLAWLLLKSEGTPEIPEDLYKLLICTKTGQCKLLEGHEGNCGDISHIDEPTHCLVCRETIKFEDFKRAGRTDPISIQMGHIIPLSRGKGGHNASNVIWTHRRCNYIQGEQTIKETIETIREIVKRHGYEIKTKGV